MSEENTTPVEPSTSQQQSSQPNTDWEARYKGTVRKIEELTLGNRSLQEQNTILSSEKEQLNVRLSQLETEKTVGNQSWEQKYTEIIEKSTKAAEELRGLQTWKVKYDVAREVDPRLLPVLDTLPNIEDRDTLKNIMSGLTGWADGLVKDREKQILSGVTPPLGGSPAIDTGPKTRDDWKKHIDSLPPGSKERTIAMNKMWDFFNAGGAL